jgi:Lanthionine-containing peptide SapB precursor RamS
MALLDMQAMEQAACNGHGHGSDVSLLLCDSAASVTVCL